MEDSIEDVHICLKCNTEIKGLMAYVEHRRSNCSESSGEQFGGTGDAPKAPIEEQVDEDYTDYNMIDEEILPGQTAVTVAEVSPVTNQPNKRGRKRKQVTPQPSPQKISKGPSAQKSNNQKASGQEEHPPEVTSQSQDSPGVSVQNESGDSPRRSSRRGIRISYTDLLSGVDRSEAKKSSSGPSLRASEAKSPKKATKKERKVTDPENEKEQKEDEIDEGVVSQTSKMTLGQRVKLRAAATKKMERKHQERLSPKSAAHKKVVLKKKKKATTKKESEKRTRNIKGIKNEKANSDAEVEEGGIDLSTAKKVVLKKKATPKKGSEKRTRNIKGRKNELKVMIEAEEEEVGIDLRKAIALIEEADEKEIESVVYIKEGQFYCDICQIYCKSKKKMDAHCETHKHLKKVRLGRASRVQEDTDSDLEENGSTSVRAMLHCGACSYKTKNAGQYKRHLRSITHAQRANISLFPCQKCHRKYKTEEELEAHLGFHDIPRCRQCKETFETQELLEQHLDEMLHRIEHRCPVCDKVFSTKGNLGNHMRGHDPNKVFRCDMCEYTSAQWADMKRHNFRHLGVKPFKCGLCEFESLTKNGLERHMKTHTQRTKDVKCEECGSCFYDQTLLRQHKYMRHNNERRFPCDFEGCTFAFKYRSSLVIHQRMHTQEKPYLCADCGYATSTKYSLTKHIRLHTGEKPFRCDFPSCNYSCRLSTHLSRHKIIHTGTKPFKCPFCPYACNNKQNLRKHMLTTKVHADVQMYKCTSCPDYSTNVFRDYVIHVRKEHGDDEKYISFFEIAESINQKAENVAAQQNEDSAAARAVEAAILSDESLQTFSVVTIIPGKKGSKRSKKITIMDDRDEVQKKLEQVILALEDTTTEVEANRTEEEPGSNVVEQVETDVNVSNVSNLGELVALATKDFPITGENETIVMVPEVQAETEICTSEMTGTVVTTEGEADGVGGEYVQQIVVEFDQQGQVVTEEDMAAATWLHSMGNIQGVTVETIMQEEPAAEEVHE